MNFESLRILDERPRQAENVDIDRHVEVLVDGHAPVPVPRGACVPLPDGRVIEVRIASAT